MTSSFDLRSRVGWLRLVALLEAVSWVGLLVGMYFKYLGSPRTEVGVKVFGPIHGAIFVGFVAAAVVVGATLKWSIGTWLLALLASILPLATVIFLIWADRAGKMSGSTGVPAVTQPARAVPESA